MTEKDSRPRSRHPILWLAAAVTLLAGSVSAEDSWQAVTEPRVLVFPRDHAAHENYRIEWWYYTGNLGAEDRRRFGYELTFFRTGVDRAPQNPSRWAIRDLYIAHFAISDIHQRKHHPFERINRRGVGWAGAATDRYQVWNGDWSAHVEDKEETHVLSAQDGPYRLDLRLTPQIPPVLHGERGMSRKGPAPGNASYYYSLPGMRTAGTLTVEGRPYSVSGESWMDHEFSSSFLEPGQQGWDWLAIRLDDGRRLMLYQIRRHDGTVDPFSSGTLVRPDGPWEPLHRDDFTLLPGKSWTSPASGAVYPIQWTIRLPRHRLDLAVEAAFPAQEMNTVASNGFPYWEGSITVRGASAGQPIEGEGYLEMTGYVPEAR